MKNSKCFFRGGKGEREERKGWKTNPDLTGEKEIKMKKEMYMKKNKLMALAISATLLVGGSIALAACKNKEDSNEKEADVASSATRSSGNNASSGSNSSSANATVELLKLTDKDQETSYDEATAQKIELSDNCGKINITKEGTYIVTGSTNNGMIIINVNSEEDVHLILRDAAIVSESSAAIYVMSADEVYITLEGENRLSNGGVFANIDSEDIDSVIYSKDDLTVNGSGSLTITSPSGHGIVCKDDLVLCGGNYIITAKEDGINTNDSILFTSGTYTIECQDDAIHTDGMLEFEGGTYSITGAEGLEGTYVLINEGDFTIEATDDGINAGQKSDAYYPTIEINGGTIRVTMGQGDTDGLDANGNLYINGGTVEVNAQNPFDYDGEGVLSGGTVIVNGQEVTVLTSQDMGGFGGHGGKGGNGGQNGNFEGRGGKGQKNGQMQQGAMPDDMTPPDGQMPEDMTPPDGQMPEDMTPPDLEEGQMPMGPKGDMA